ncbi:MAG: hypothetical protein UZ21_OP11001001123 [Microgenomates bacterium OLB22]|nr:MAG: hypothetical protein UZ21_OP11001001123 [Microgenomates bacterium OLB22]
MTESIKSSSTFMRISLLVLAKITVLLCVSFLVSIGLPYEPVFSYPGLLQESGLPHWIYSFGHFDGPHYVTIAEKGYHQYQQAFFPVFPMSIRLVEQIVSNYVAAGLLISNMFSILAYFLLYHFFFSIHEEAVVTLDCFLPLSILFFFYTLSIQRVFFW